MHHDETRRAERGSWPARVIRGGHELGEDDLSGATTPEERLAMMWPLAEQAWSFARRPVPAYDRRSMPAAVIRPGRARR